nr:SDR family oxidoreductase [uncultured Rhodoferax sp.]
MRVSQLKLLVTGANGFVGRSLLETLNMSGHDVVPCVRNAAGLRGERSIGSIDGSSDWSSVLTGCQAVIHLAARVHVMHEKTGDPLHEFRKTNVVGTLNLARQAAALGVKRFVFLSSIKVNGESTDVGAAFTPGSPPCIVDPYGVSKWEAEQGLRKIAADTGMELVIIRSPLIYGKGVGANFAQLIGLVRKKLPLPFGAIDNRRSLIAIDNLTNFISLCVNHPKAAGETFLVSDGDDISTPELVRRIAAAEGCRASLWPIPVWLLMAAGSLFGRRKVMERLCGNLQVDMSKAYRLLGWRPVIEMQAALKKMAEDDFKDETTH